MPTISILLPSYLLPTVSHCWIKRRCISFQRIASPIKVFHSFLTGFPSTISRAAIATLFLCVKRPSTATRSPWCRFSFAQSAKRFQQWMVYRSFCHSPARFLCRVWSWNSAWTICSFTLCATTGSAIKPDNSTWFITFLLSFSVTFILFWLTIFHRARLLFPIKKTAALCRCLL